MSDGMTDRRSWPDCELCRGTKRVEGEECPWCLGRGVSDESVSYSRLRRDRAWSPVAQRIADRMELIHIPQDPSYRGGPNDKGDDPMSDRIVPRYDVPSTDVEGQVQTHGGVITLKSYGFSLAFDSDKSLGLWNTLCHDTFLMSVSRNADGGLYFVGEKCTPVDPGCSTFTNSYSIEKNGLWMQADEIVGWREQSVRWMGVDNERHKVRVHFDGQRVHIDEVPVAEHVADLLPPENPASMDPEAIIDELVELEMLPTVKALLSLASSMDDAGEQRALALTEEMFLRVFGLMGRERLYQRRTRSLLAYAKS